MTNCSNRQKKYIIRCSVPEGTDIIEYRVRIGEGSEIFAGRCNYFDGDFEIDCNDWIESHWTKGGTPADTIYIDLTYTDEDGIVTTATESLAFDKDPILGTSVEEHQCVYMDLILHNSDFKVTYPTGQDEWYPVEWNAVIDGQYVWTDNQGHTYYSLNDEQMELKDGVWVPKTWNITITSGKYIWKDGDGTVYYSELNNYGHYVLSDGRWVRKTWGGGYTGYWRAPIWVDYDGNCHSDNGYADHYKEVDDFWSMIHWKYYLSEYQGTLSAEEVWTDYDGNIYFSQANNGQYLVSREHEDTIVEAPFTGIKPRGKYIWKDGKHIYYSYETTQYELIDNRWVPKDWGDTFPRDATKIWKDAAGHIYYSTNLGVNYAYRMKQEESYDITIPLQVQNGILRGTTRNSLDKVTYMDRYGDIHNGSASNRYFLECYVDADWMKTLTGMDVNYVKYMLAMQTARKAELTGTASISGMDMVEALTDLECRVADIEKVETHSRYNGTHRVPALKITIEVFV